MSDPARAEPILSPAQVRANTEAFWRRVLHAAWLAVLLGLALEALLLAVAAGLGRFPEWVQLVASTVRRVSWSTVVCGAITCGLAAQKARPTLIGALGFLAAPLALIAARAAHKAALSALGTRPGGEAASILVPALIKALEYGVFGVLLARLGAKSNPLLREHLAAGAAIGAVFGTVVILALPKIPPATDVVLLAINELCFPVGCAFVVYVTGMAARRNAR